MDNKTFANLQKKSVLGIQFDFYSDFRLDTALIKQICQDIIRKELQADEDVKLLLQLLNAAVHYESGLIVYGD